MERPIVFMYWNTQHNKGVNFLHNRGVKSRFDAILIDISARIL